MRTYSNKRDDGFNEFLQIRWPYKSRKDINDGNDYGVSGLRMWFVLEKDKKAVQFMMYLSAYPESKTGDYGVGKITAFDIGYHSPYPMWEGQTPQDTNCIFTGGVCYYDGSGLRADEIYEKLERESINNVKYDMEQKIFEMLEEEWNSIFKEKENKNE